MGEEVKDYKIGKDLDTLKQVLKGTLKGRISAEEKEQLESLYELTSQVRKNSKDESKTFGEN